MSCDEPDSRGIFVPSCSRARSVALDYSAAFFAAALRAPVFLRADAFIPALRPRQRRLFA